MAILLIKDRDAKMSTVAEWRAWMNSTGIPQAQAYLAEHPYAEKAIADLKRLTEYQAARSSFEAYLSGKVPLSPLEVLAVNKTISDYEAAPLSPWDLASIVEHHRPTLDPTTPNETDPKKWRGPSIADQWRCHKNRLEVDAVKSDAVKAAELAEKGQRGCYKLGDVVQVFEDGTRCVIPPAPPFYIVEITGLSKALAEKYTQPDIDLTDPENPIILRRRKYGIAVAAIPTAIRTALQTNRYVKVSWTQVRDYVRNKLTGVGE
jgi:hypothetical protein